MRWPAKLRLRLRSLLQRNRVEEELDEELRFHLEHLAAQYMAEGMSPTDARYAALREMGGLDRRKEECRDARGLALFDDLRNDLRFAFRQLLKNRGFATAAILTLALGIGSNTAIFSVVNGVLLRPLPYEQPGQLVQVFELLSPASGTESFPESSRTGRSRPPRLKAWQRSAIPT